MSARREARAQATETVGHHIPAKLLAGPDLAVWSGHVFDAWHDWKDARDAWMVAQGWDPHRDYRLLPPELHDRGPFDSRKRKTDGRGSHDDS